MRHLFRPEGPRGRLAQQMALARLVATEPSGANYTLLGNVDADLRDFAAARQAYLSASTIYSSKGLSAEAYMSQRLAQRYETRAIPFIHEPTPKQPRTRLAKYEPSYGCYTGAFIDHEDSIRGTYRDEYGEWRRDAQAFNHLTKTHHAIFFGYLGYGREFPTKFVRHLNDNGAAAQIAMEPTRLSDVQDDAYLHGLAREARASKTPIFLRFASEMNGDWTPYNGDPALYKEKFRLVARVMHAEAPNVAMVWCPFETPVRTIRDYYPGPESVDWVGINIYSVPYWDNSPKRPASWRNPADQLRYIYGQYARTHPIMICEYAASHRSSLDGTLRSEFAQTKMSELYAALPRLYPRVKAVCWLSMNTIKHALPGRQLNDYSLLNDEGARSRYERLLMDPYYLDKVPRHGHAAAPQETIALKDGAKIDRPTSLSAWVKTYDDAPRVKWLVNGKVRVDSSLPGPHRWVLDPKTVKPGPAKVEILVQDAEGRKVADVVRRVTIASRA